MSQKNKAPKLYVVEKKTASGKSWSRKPVAEARSFASAVDKLVAVPGKTGDYRVRKLAAGTQPTKVLAVRSYSLDTNASLIDA